MALKHIFKVFFCFILQTCLQFGETIWIFFMSNVSIINVFNHIFLSEVILKIRIIKLKRTATTFLNLILLSSYNYLRRFIWFDYDAS